MVLRRWLILLLLWCPLVAAAQVDEALEQWVEEKEDEAPASELNDLLLQLRDDPVNVNDTVALRELPFLSQFQLKALRNYILLHGQLLTLDELLMVPGFDSAQVALLRPLLKAEWHRPPESFSLKEMLGRGRHTLVAGIGGTLEQAQGYGDGRYEGDNLRALFCYSYNFADRISLRVSADKDPAEAWGKDNFYGYHLMVRDLGPLEKLVVGRYNLQFGQGIALWTGFEPFSLTGASPIRYGTGVRPASAFYEQGWQEGVAASVSLGTHASLSGFGSRSDGAWMGGGHIDFYTHTLQVGVTAAATRLDDSVQLRDYVYNRDYFRGDRQATVGVDAMWRWGDLLLFGEVAADQKMALAGIAGLRISAGGDNSFGVTLRHYDPQYHNLYAHAYSIGSTMNEQGLSLDAHLRLPLRVTALLSADLHRFPGLRYRSYAPSSGVWLRAQVGRDFGRRAKATLRYAYRQKQNNIPNIDSTLYLAEENVRQQLQAQVQVTAGGWRFVTRAVAVDYEPDQSPRQWGWLVAEEARYQRERLQVTAQAAWFDVSGYYARIYLSESNLQYAYSMPSLSGRGLRASLTARWDLSRHLNLSLKYTLTAYADRTAIGSGAATIDANHLQTWHLQLRCKF